MKIVDSYPEQDENVNAFNTNFIGIQLTYSKANVTATPLDFDDPNSQLIKVYINDNLNESFGYSDKYITFSKVEYLNNNGNPDTGTLVTINLFSVGINLVSNRKYTIEVPEGFFKDKDGNLNTDYVLNFTTS